ncbi:MAG: hypothetical protein LBI36_06755 [Oscillospiraceae bacterium]|jgi:enamine deaminase RidA (YjgF/YER057c/UK114 family)|nr:hypothetical protein [Oscillospiraceae bacterium]
MPWNRENFSSGAPLEAKVGYSRMVKKGPFVFVGGTTSVQPDGSVFAENDAYGQTKYVLEKLVKLLAQAGASPSDVVSVKVYSTDMKTTPDVGRAYTEIFFDVKPLFTVVGTSALNRPTQIVEIEMTAVLDT